MVFMYVWYFDFHDIWNLRSKYNKLMDGPKHAKFVLFFMEVEQCF